MYFIDFMRQFVNSNFMGLVSAGYFFGSLTLTLLDDTCDTICMSKYFEIISYTYIAFFHYTYHLGFEALCFLYFWGPYWCVFRLERM